MSSVATAWIAASGISVSIALHMSELESSQNPTRPVRRKTSVHTSE